MLPGSQAPQTPADLHRAASRAIKSGTRSAIDALFIRSADATYLYEMAQRRGGLRGLRVFAMQAPSDQNFGAAYWIVVSTRHDLEDDHDIIFPAVQQGSGWKLGPEIGETVDYLYAIKHARIDAKLWPSQSTVDVTTALQLVPKGKPKNLIFRLNLPYELKRVSVNKSNVEVKPVNEDTLVLLDEKSAVKVGGIVVVPTPTAVNNAEIAYSGRIQSENEDTITEKYAHVTAWWVPSINRQPYTTRTRVLGPNGWVLMSEGEPVPQSESAFVLPEVTTGWHIAEFRCDVPISYPKIVAGSYVKAAERTVGGRLFTSYQLEPVEQARADRDVNLIEDSIAWYEKNLGPFPFSRYAVFDAEHYYGIESYSYTLLQRGITTRFVTHEIGHTYFGGLVPCSYTVDASNESLTQYVDSVLYGKNKDGSLEAGLRTLNVAAPLTKMSVPHAHGSATYYRGAYVLRMLENEIGTDAMMKGLQLLVRSRKGLDTTWTEVRQAFEAVTGQKLDWFWEQWIEASSFPTLQIDDAISVQRNGKWRSYVKVKVYGEQGLYRMKFKVRASLGTERWETLATMNGNTANVEIDSEKKPTEVLIDPFGYALVHVGGAKRIAK